MLIIGLLTFYVKKCENNSNDINNKTNPALLSKDSIIKNNLSDKNIITRDSISTVIIPDSSERTKHVSKNLKINN